MAADAAIDPAISEPSGGRVFARALKNATSDLKGIGGLVLALTAAIAGYFALRDVLKAPGYWPEAAVAAFFVAFYFLYVHPAWRDERKRQRLNDEGVRGQLKDPAYFRLSPYEPDDKERFTRPDGAVKSAHKWIVDSNIPLLYLSGQSGVGKSSLLNAAIVPALANSGWVVVPVRPHDDPFGAISAELLKPNAVWQKPPSGNVGDPRGLVERAADRIQKQGKRLLFIIDQFEEALIVCNETVRADLARFLVDLVQRPINGLVVVLVLRAEYLNDLADLGLPAPSYGQNALEVRPFTRAAAQAFIEASKLDPGAGLLEKVLQEAAEIEDMPDKVRPIVLNMFGLIIASFKGSLPKGVEPGRLLSGYVERSLNNPAIRGVAVEILRPLVTDVATKRALPIDRIAEAARVPRMVARGCLIALANDGLVRPLDKGGDRWEVAHDFVARLLQPIVRNWRKSAWESARPWLAPAALSVWLVAAVATIFVFHDDFILRDLGTVGLVPGAPNDQGSATFQNGRPIEDQPKFWRVASRMADLSYLVAGLTINNRGLTTLDGMPALPVLTSLDLSFAGLTSLQGMPALPLQKLDLSATGVDSLEPLKGLTALSWLKLRQTNVHTLEPLKGLTALQWLDLSGTRVESLEPLKGLTALRFLDLSFNKIETLEPLRGLTALQELSLVGIPRFETLQSIEDLPTLRKLYIWRNAVPDAEWLRFNRYRQQKKLQPVDML